MPLTICGTQVALAFSTVTNPKLATDRSTTLRLPSWLRTLLRRRRLLQRAVMLEARRNLPLLGRLQPLRLRRAVVEIEQADAAEVERR
jgi:hypothetical protein